MKQILILLSVLTLLLAVPLAFAQEEGEDHSEEPVAGETVEEAEHGEEEEAGGISALGINLGFLFAQIVNFLVIAGALGVMLWRPAVNMLDQRSAKIQKGLEDAAAAAKARQNAEAEAEKILSEARTERQRLLEDARQQGDEIQKQIESEARTEAERIRNEAHADAEAQRNTALADLREQVLQISTAVAGRVLNEQIDAEKNSQLVSDFFTRLPQGAKNLSGTVEVVSAMPLSDEEKQKVESEISAGGYNYAVDPAILGGLIIRSQDRVIDGSVRGNLNNLAGTLR